MHLTNTFDKIYFMKPALSIEVKEVFEATHYRPAISIIMPFEPQMNAKAVLTHQLKLAIEKVDREVHQNYQNDLADLVIQKLKKVVRELNFNTFKKSIAIYVSPVFEKVLYLDIPMEQKVVVDDIRPPVIVEILSVGAHSGYSRAL